MTRKHWYTEDTKELLTVYIAVQSKSEEKLINGSTNNLKRGSAQEITDELNSGKEDNKHLTTMQVSTRIHFIRGEFLANSNIKSTEAIEYWNLLATAFGPVVVTAAVNNNHYGEAETEAEEVDAGNDSEEDKSVSKRQRLHESGSQDFGSIKGDVNENENAEAEGNHDTEAESNQEDRDRDEVSGEAGGDYSYEGEADTKESEELFCDPTSFTVTIEKAREDFNKFVNNKQGQQFLDAILGFDNYLIEDLIYAVSSAFKNDPTEAHKFLRGNDKEKRRVICCVFQDDML